MLKLTRSILSVLCAVLALVALRADAATVGSGGMLQTSGPDTDLVLDFSGPLGELGGYTFGLFSLSDVNVAIDDRNFQFQALSADNVTVLHTAGDDVANQYVIETNPEEVLGLFLLQDATLRDFSLGTNPFRPIFSVDGAPGSHLIDPTGDDTFSLDLLRQGIIFGGGLGVVAPTLDGSILLSISETTRGSGDEPVSPVVPEPSTIILIAVGLVLLFMFGHKMRWRRRPRASAH